MSNNTRNHCASLIMKKRRICSGNSDKMQEQKYLHKNLSHFKNLNEMRLQDKWCDVTIKLNEKEIRAHKVILAANIKYFNNMLSNDSFKESREGFISMESVDEKDVEAFVSYAYTGEILVTDSNALNLLELANYLGEDEIKTVCIKFLKKYLKVEDACRAFKYASIIGSSTLKNAAKAKILRNFDICSQSSDYLDFGLENLMDILSDVKAYPIHWQQIFLKGIIRWIIHDAKNRKIYIHNLLSSINITGFTDENLLSGLSENQSDEYDIVNDVKLYRQVSENQQKDQKKVLMILGQIRSPKFYFQFYNFFEKKWSPAYEIEDTDNNFYGCSAVCNDNLYCIIQGTYKNDLQVFNRAAKRFETLLSSPSILSFSAMCACSRFIYLCGGTSSTNNSIFDQVLRYDPQNNSFERLPQMPTKKTHAAAVFYQGSLYVLGGWNFSAKNSVEKYDPETRSWTTCAPMCESRNRLEVVVFDGKLYACGGCSKRHVDPSSVEVYDPSTNRWQLIAKMNKLRGGYCLVAHEGKLLALGGTYSTGEKKGKIIEVYDPNKNQWYIDQEMSEGLKIDYHLGGLVSSSCITDEK